MDLQIAPITHTGMPSTLCKRLQKFSNGANELLTIMPTATPTQLTKPTESQLAEYKEAAKQWAQERLADQDTVIVDLESTGLLSKDPETEIVQICILNMQGRPLFNMLLKPAQPMSEEVIAIHRIQNEQVVNQPIFPQVAKLIAFILENKHVVCFNADFDIRLLWHMFKKYKQTLPKVKDTSCCMDKYSEWTGEWNSKKEGFKWQKLPNFLGEESHDAYNDCRNTLLTMKKMAGMYDEKSTAESDISLDF
jgi:DNA polymerase III epsilon subunit-like protein